MILYRDTKVTTKIPISKLVPKRYGNNIPTMVSTFYFGETTTGFGGILKRWTGSVWTKAKLVTYVGGTFINKTLKVFKDGNWKIVDHL